MVKRTVMRTSVSPRRRLVSSFLKLSASTLPVLFATFLSLTAAGCGEGGGAGAATGGVAGKHELVGAAAPAFALDSVNGKGKVDMAKYKGKVVLVDFWATWCEPCKKSFPKLQELNVKYKASGVVIIGISQDDENQGLPEFGKTYGAEFPLAWDSDKSVAKKWQPKSMPASFIVDKTGIIRFAHLGYHDGDEAEVEKELKSLL